MRNFCIITGSRSEYGLLKNVIIKSKNSKTLNPKLIITGSHLSKHYGSTIKEILRDKIKIDYKIKGFLKENNLEKDILKNISILIEKFSKIFIKIKPDIILILGDRYEIFSAAIAAIFLKIPIAHIHGGETTYGSLDEYIRHSITKMSAVHFVATKKYKKRVIQLGENPKYVHMVGSLAYESILKLGLYNKKQLLKDIGLEGLTKMIIITFHPVTNLKKNSIDQIIPLLNVLENYTEYALIFTMPNADANSGYISSSIKKFVKKNYKNSKYFKSMGQLLYYSALKHSELCIGNSSSGIIEAPYLKTITINIGDRQKGREMAKSIISCKNKVTSIQKAFSKGIRIAKQKKQSYIFKNPYEYIISSNKILSVLENMKLNNDIYSKVFYDI